jgi:hypothetical protein
MSDVIPWRCKNGHVIGRVVTHKMNGRKTRELELFTRAEPDSPAPGVFHEPEILGLVAGFTDIRCTICGEVTTWWPDVWILKRMMKSHGLSQEIIALALKAIKINSNVESIAKLE